MEAAGVISCAFGLGYILQSAHSGTPGVIRSGSSSGRSRAVKKSLTRSPRHITLLIFFTSVSIWSTLQFILLLILDDGSCRISSIFVAIFDQLSRILIFSVALWGVRESVQNGAEKGVLVIFIIVRAVLGVVVVAFTRHTFMPVCFLQADTTIPHGRAAGISQLGFDGVMSVILLVRAWVAWRDSAEKLGIIGNRMGMGLFLVVLSLGGWNLAALTYLLRIGSIFVRLAPSIFTLAVLLGLLHIFPNVFFFLSTDDQEERNPFPSRMMRLGSDSSAAHSRGQRALPGYAYHTSGDLEGSTSKNGPPVTYGIHNGHGRTNSSVFRNIIVQPIVHPGTMVRWSMEQEDAKYRRNSPHHFPGATAAALAATETNKGLVETKFPTHAGGMVGISGPILKNGGFGVTDEIPGGDREELFKNMRTVSSHTAAEVERARIDAQFEREEESRRMDLQSMGRAGPSRPMRIETATTTPTTIASFAGLPTPDIVPSNINMQRNMITAMPHISAINPQHRHQASGLGISERDPLSPQNQSGYRTSTNTFFTEDDTRYTQSQAGFTLGPPPLPASRSNPTIQSSTSDQKVLFLKDIEYDDPSLVHSLMSQQLAKDTARSTGRYTRSSRGVLRRSPPANSTDMKLVASKEDSSESPVLPNGVPVMQRMRSIKRESSARVLFPRETRFLEEEHKTPRKSSVSSQKIALASPLPPPTEPLPAPPVPKMPIEHLPIMKKSPTVSIEPESLSLKKLSLKLEALSVTEEPKITENPGKLLSVQSHNSSTSSSDTEDAIYETAKAWVASVAAVHQTAAVPVLVDVSLSRMSSLIRRESHASVHVVRSRNNSIEETPIKSSAINSEMVPFKVPEEVVDRYRDSTVIRKSGITFLASPVLEESEGEDDHDVTKTVSPVLRKKSYESVDLTDDVVSLSPDDGYSTDEEDNDDNEGDYFSGPSPMSTDNDDVVISNLEDALEFERMHIARRNLDTKLEDLMNDVPNFDSLAMPRHFKLGDSIPNFYSARGNEGYGKRRKMPPVPLGLVPLRPKFTNPFQKGKPSQVRPSSVAMSRSSKAPSSTIPTGQALGIQARLTQLMGKYQKPEPLEELIRRLPAEKKQHQQTQEDRRNSVLSDGRGSLLRQLESEVSRQENHWKGMRKSLRRESLASSVSSTLDTLASENDSTRYSQRRSFIAKLSSGINRRLSTAQASATTMTTMTTATNTSRISVEDWQRQLAEAQMAYLAEAPELTNRVREAEMGLKSDGTMMDTDEVSDLSLSLSPSPTPLPARAMEFDPYTISNANLSHEITTEAPVLCEEVEVSPFAVVSKFCGVVPQLWSAPPVEVEIARPQCLWMGQRAVVPEASPAAINLRPRKRFDQELPILKSSLLWKRSREISRSVKSLLWNNPKDLRPRSIMSHHRRSSSIKRVTFVEDVITVEPTGIMGRLKKLWGGKKNTKKSQTSIEIPPPLPSPAKLRTLNRIPIAGMLEIITKKYEKKALPQLPLKNTLPTPPIFAGRLWVKTRPSVTAPQTLLWPSSRPLGASKLAYKGLLNTRKDNTQVIKISHSSKLWVSKSQDQIVPAKNINGLWPTGTIERREPAKEHWHPQHTPRSRSRTDLKIDLNIIRTVQAANPKKSIAVHSKNMGSPMGLWLLTQHQKTPLTGLLSAMDAPSSIASSIRFEEAAIISAKMVQWTRPSRGSVVFDVNYVAERINDVPDLPDVAIPGLWRKRKELPSAAAAPSSTSLLWERGIRQQSSEHNLSELTSSSTQRPTARTSARYIELIVVVGGNLWSKTNNPKIDRSHRHANHLWIDGRAGKSQHGSSDARVPALDNQSTPCPLTPSTIPSKFLPPAQHPQPSNTRLWSSSQNSKYLCMTMTAAAPAPQLWTRSSADTKDLFANSLPSPTRPKQQPIFAAPAASGSLWQRPRSDSKPEKPRLWKPASTKGLWTRNGETVTLADIEAAKREVALLWNKSRDAASLFADQPVDTLRSKRDVSTKTLPIIEKGLWRKQIEEEIEKDVPREVVLWSGVSPPKKEEVKEEVKVFETKTATTSMWSKDNDSTPDLFANLPTDSCVRSKKEHSTETLPVFSEELWKTAVPLPTQPSLWTPIRKPTGLWDAPTYTAAITPISLQQIALEKKKAQKLLWCRKTARRTTEAEPERTRAAIRPSDQPLAVVSGKLWHIAKPVADKGLWKRRVRSKTVASETIPAVVPLWSKGTARRTTKLAPERGAFVKKVTGNISLTVVSGSLWTKKEEKDEVPTLWNKDSGNQGTQPQLWSQYSAVRTQVPKPNLKPKFEEIEDILTPDSTSLWLPPSPEPKTSLWKPQLPPTPAQSPQTEESSSAPLWTKATARRQTDKIPQRVAPALRKSSVVLEKASGTMWGQQDEPLSPMAMGGLSRASTISTASTVSASEETQLDDIQFHVHANHSTKNSVSNVLGAAPVIPATATKGGLWAPAPPQEKEKTRA